VYFLAHANGRLQASRLILGGVAIAYCLGGVTSLIVLTADQRELANSVLTWTLGSLAGTLGRAGPAGRCCWRAWPCC
jgi:iron complex transport system permease protein